MLFLLRPILIVDKNQLITLLAKYSETSIQEAEEIISLKSEYPYSQVLHTMAARVSRDHNFDSQQSDLQMAAIYSADRTVLKDIIQSVPEATHPSVSVESISADREDDKIQHVKPEKEAVVVSVVSADNSDVAEELMRDLEKLNSSRHNFEMLLVEYSELKAKPSRQVKDVTTVKDIEKPSEMPKQKSTKSKRERIIELAKNKTVSSNAKTSSGKTKATGKKNHQPDELIDHIESSKKEIVPESAKQKEQIAIINHFIKTSPSIANAKDRLPAPTGDLNPIKSGEFGDNIVSETLVEILIKQGKKDKAIEVLKKLIWKYPQKKSYFASQIEDLKK